MSQNTASERKNNYKPSLQDLKDEYEYLNCKIFKNQLFNPGKIIIIRQANLKHAWGDCGPICGKKYLDNFDIKRGDQILIRMQKKYPDYSFCRAILAHEMIHAYQYIKYGDSDHNDSFYNEWTDAFKEYQIPLSEYY